jgi:hypothetical protein
LYDTEVFGPGISGPNTLFAHPIGGPNSAGRVKTEADTNMTMSSTLPFLLYFDWHAWRTEFATDVPFEQVLAFRFYSRIRFFFTSPLKTDWFSVPLSYLPLSAYREIEALKEIAPVLVSYDSLERFKEAWDRARTVATYGSPDPKALFEDRTGIYKHERARIISFGPCFRPARIRSGEIFGAEVATDWSAPGLPDKPLAVRLYLEGFLGRPI